MDLAKFSYKRICVAVSGGMDSMTLLHYVKMQAESKAIVLTAVHCEHGIRGEDSRGDRAFVEKICREWQIPLFCFSEDCIKKAKNEKCSLETAARNFRQDCFLRLLSENKTDYIATAHHLADEAETILFRLARGTSLTGVQGILEENGAWIRPLLDWTKDDIKAYVQANGIEYRVDRTNFERDATRNKLRLDVLPLLENAVPGTQKNLCRFAKLAREDDEYLYDLAADLLVRTKDGFFVRNSDRAPLFRRACLLAMKALGITQDYTQAHLDSLFALQSLERGARISLPHRLQAIRAENGICFCYRKETHFLEKPSMCAFCENGFDGGRYAVNVRKERSQDRRYDLPMLRIDADCMPKDAVFRFRQDGDYMMIFGGMKKSLKKIFNERKIPVEERADLPLIASGVTHEVYVICGVEISERLRITDDTRRALYITIEKKENENYDAQ